MNWNAPAAKKLDELAAALPVEPKRRIVVFGSAPLQILLAGDFLSRDVDIFLPEDDDFLANFVEQNGFSATESKFGFQVTDHHVFRSAEGWWQRAVEVEKRGHIFMLPHPWDILVGKLHRLEEKDLEAFRLVLKLTGHPTADEFKRHLQKAVDHYRPKFDEETQGGDLLLNTQLLWQEIYHTSIDVRAEIIRPALERQRIAYEQQNRGDASLKSRLGQLGT